MLARELAAGGGSSPRPAPTPMSGFQRKPGMGGLHLIFFKKTQQRKYKFECFITFLASSFFSLGTWYITEKTSHIPIDSKKLTSLVVPITSKFFPYNK
jgi:hypothetical protein